MKFWTHPLLVSQACQVKLGTTKRVCDGPITLDDYDAQSLEVARRVGTGLFIMRIDHLTRDDCVSNPLLNGFVMDFDDDPGVDSVARDSDQSNSFDFFTHAMVNARCCEFPRSVLQDDTIIVSCGLANFERTSWSTQRRHEFKGSYEELDTGADYDKLDGSFEDNYPKLFNGHSIWSFKMVEDQIHHGIQEFL